MNRFYPIGSVVKLETDSDKMVMIIGYYPINNETKKLYHYLAVPYPNGISNEYSFQVFNYDDIKEFLFAGYMEEEGKILIDALPALEQEILQQIQSKD